jgi:hypothetical protein
MATASKDYRESDHGCHERARARGQQTFTLVAQDPTAPAVIAEWIKHNIETAPEEKLRDALEEALIMRKHPARKPAD